MKMIDPTYLRFVCDELNSGKLDKSNLSGLPISVSSFFDKIFDYENLIIERKDLLDKFTNMALLRSGISLEYTAILTASPIYDWQQFIQRYSRYFNLDSLGNYRFFHDRFIVYLFQRSNNSIIRRNAHRILENIDLVNDNKWVIENKGYFLYLNAEVENLFAHISLHREQKLKSWWIKDLERLLDGLYSSNEIHNVDFTVLCELLRGCFDFIIQRKGVRIIVINSSYINWDVLDSFFDTTRFQYELAIEFSKYPQKLPKNWEKIFLNEDHPCSYTFSYVWKYSQFNVNYCIDKALINKVWIEGSPFQRIIVIMIWGYQKLNGNHNVWFDELIVMKNDWQYLLDERDTWVSCLEDKNNLKYQREFIILKLNLEERYHYILDSYWSLFDELEKLNEDVHYLWRSAYALDIAFWIYRHPVWEIGKIANEIVVKRLRVEDMRSETIDWLLENWEAEEFYALGEVIFELKTYLEIEDFLTLIRRVINTSNCQLRGSFISDLVVYLEGAQNEEFCETIANDILPYMVDNASDIWEVQELIRLLKFFLELSLLNENQINVYLNKMEIARDINNPLDMDYNEFWKQAEKNKGINR
jgi:hypothetical protein